MDLERRFLVANLAGAKLEKRADDQPAELSGYAAVFYRAGVAGTEYELWEGMFERFLPGCFDDAIKNDDVRCLFNHDANLILGRNVSGTLALSVDSVGLAFRCTLPDTTAGRDLKTSVERGDVSGCSIGMIVTERRWIEKEDGPAIREIVKVQLFDVGPVTYPAYAATSVATRSRDAITAEIETELRKPAADRQRRAKIRQLRIRMLAHQSGH